MHSQIGANISTRTGGRLSICSYTTTLSKQGQHGVALTIHLCILLSDIIVHTSFDIRLQYFIRLML